MKRSEIFFGLIRIPVDAAAALAALLASYALRSRADVLKEFLSAPDLGIFPEYGAYFRMALLAAAGFVIITGLFGMYSLRATDSFAAELRKIFFSSVIWLMAVITYYFVIREFPFSRLVLFYSAAFIFIFVSFGRAAVKVIQRIFMRFGLGARRVIFVGENAIAHKLAKILEYSASIRIVATVNNYSELAVLMARTSGYIADEIIQTRDDHEEAEKIIALCRENHLHYSFVPDVLEVHRSNVEVRTYAGIPLISLKPTPLDGWGKVIKRAFDIVFSLIGLIALSPFFLIIAIAIKIDSRGTIFFRYLDDGEKAMRTGQLGHRFFCLKFRTMKTGTHFMRYTTLAERNLRKGSPLVKIKDDPRITAVGCVLRRFSLDELPQLWNVLIGDMSIAGPRPHLPEEVSQYEGRHKFLLSVKPGITGLAQISGRSDLPFEEEVRLDTYYIENWSLWLDAKILLKTLFVVLRGYKE